MMDHFNLDYELLSFDFDVVIEGVNCRMSMPSLLEITIFRTQNSNNKKNTLIPRYNSVNCLSYYLDYDLAFSLSWQGKYTSNKDSIIKVARLKIE